MTLQQTIEEKISSALTPHPLEVINESSMHNVPEGSESHFRLRIVSDHFEGQRLVERHRTINQLLETELSESIHALAMETLTPEEWQARGGATAESPECLGGDAPRG